MQKTEILADLRAQFGPQKSTLYANELAQVLGKSTKAIYGLKDRGGLPVPILPGPGRPCVSIHAVVDWLAGDVVYLPKKEVEQAPSMPQTRRKSMAAYLSTLRGQIDFLHELYAELEKIELQNELANEKDET